MKRKSSDRKNSVDNSQKMMSRRYESDLKATVKYLKDKFGKDVIIHHKMSYAYFPRRIKAYSNYANFICETYGGEYQYIDIQKELSFIGSLPYVPNLDILNNYFNISLAIAIYILDSLKDCGCLSEAVMYIPSERELLNRIYLPDNFHYPTYSNELIKGVIFLIEYRNGNVNSESNYKEVFYNEINANTKNSNQSSDYRIRTEKQFISMIQPMDYSQRLKYLISFLPPEVLSRAEENFKDKINYCADLILSEFDYFEKSNSGDCEDESDKTDYSEEEMLALKILTVFRFCDKNNYRLLHSVKSKKGNLKIENPYEMCFGAFYSLEYQGSDYAWLIELCGIIAEIACSMLPWYKRPDFSSQETIEYQCVLVHTLNYVYYQSWDGSFEPPNDEKFLEKNIV